VTAQPVEANVVLTTDNSQYDQAMDQSAQSTNNLAKSVDTLGTKINNLAKSAGRKMLGITVADVAVITGATAAWASYEKQMSRLQAQAAITTRSREQENRVMKDYTASVKNLRSEYGTTTQEAAALTQQISKLSDQTRPIKDLSDTFEQMSKATGESSTGLANSLLNLQKIMGTPQSQTKNYADQLTYLAAKSNTSATALADFTAQIAPMGRAMGMSQTQVTGFSNMFVKAGQDGYSAATAFNKVAQDITQAVQTGSPDLHKYANILGITVEQFKGLSGAEQVAGFLDQIAKLGPRAAQELNRFGLDGVRMSRAITGTVQASGGAMNALREANIGYGSDSVAKGAEAAETMSDTMARLRQDVQQTAESFGKAFGPGIDLVLRQVEKLASGFQNLMDGPLGKFLQVVAAVVIPVTAAAGALLLLSGTILKLAAAFTVLRGSPMLGVFEGWKGGAQIVPEMANGIRTGEFVAQGTGVLGRRGAQIAEGGTWAQRGLYNMGQGFGSTARAGWRGLGRLGADDGGPNIWTRGGAAGLRFGGEAFRTQLDAMRYANPADRSQFFARHFMGRGADVEGAVVATNVARQRATDTMTAFNATRGAAPEEREAAKKLAAEAQKQVAAAETAEKAVLSNAAAQMKAAEGITKSGAAVNTTFAALRAEGASLAAAFAGAARGGIGAGLGAAGRGIAGAASAMGPLNIALLGSMLLPLAIPLIQKFLPKREEVQNFSGFGAAYSEAAGVTPPTGSAAIFRAARGPARTMRAATSFSQVNVAAATAPDYKLNEAGLKGLSAAQATTLLGTRWSSIKNSPEAVGQVRDDLINQFGVEGAQKILGDLQAGATGGGLAGLYSQINAGQDTGTNIGLVGEVMTSQMRQAAQARGPAGQFQAQARGLSSMLGATLTSGRSQEDMLKELNQTFGLDIGDDIFNKARTRAQVTGQTGMQPAQIQAQERAGTLVTAESLAAMPRAQQLKWLIENSSGDQADKIRASLNIPQGTTGTALDAAIAKTLSTSGQALSDTQGTLAQRIRQQGPAGRMFAGSAAVQEASGFEAQNVGANVKAINEMLDKMHTAGMSAPEITKAMGKIQSALGDPTDPNYILAGMISGQSQQELQLAMPNMTRAQQFGTQVAMFQNVAAIRPVTDEQYQNAQDAKAQMATAMTDQENYFKQMLLMQDQYEIQRRRAQEDYNLQRGYEEHDFQLQRSRAEEQFHRSQARATADYYRGVRRAHYDFNLQRKRAEDDYDHSIEVQAKQMASSVYDIYTRVQLQRTSSASMLLANAGDQLTRMRQQSADLDRLRGMGMTNLAIQQLGLNNPQNQQELARFIGDVTPQMIKQFNRVAGTERVKAAKDLMQDPGNLEWAEQVRSHRIQLQRSREDFHHQLELGHEDFLRAIHRQRKDFGITMDQQADDFDTQMGRQADAYATSMRRSAQDLADVGKEIDGNFETILTRATKDLTGHAQDQAAAVLKSFQKLKGDTEPEAVALMTSLSKIFGFKYQAPKGVNTTPDVRGTNDMSMHGPGGHTVGGMHQGGVVPGWTPGRDTTMVPLSGGEAIMRPEWARAMGEGYINAANHAAKHGGFADGGLVNPDARVYMDGEPVSKITKAQLLLAEKLSRMDFRTMQGSWQPYTAYSGSSHMGPGVVDEAPGNFRTQYWLRRVGFAAWGRNFPGAASAGSGAHVHAVSLLDPGAAHQSQIAAFYAGQDGLGGMDYGPNPGMIPGLRGMLAQFSALALLHDQMQGGSGPAALPRLATVLNRRYPAAEKAAAAMQGIHPLNPGDISHIMNQMVRARYAESLEGVDPNKKHTVWHAQGGVFTDPTRIGVGEGGPEAVIPLNDQGAQFLAMAIHGAEARGIGMGSSPMRGGVSVYNTRIDKSTNFTGPITVQANDPNELLNKLQARQRVMALSRPSLTGSAA